MGLFGWSNLKSKENANTSATFDSKLREWLSSGDKDKEAFLQSEFERGKMMMKSRDVKTVHAGYDIIGPVAAMGHIEAKLFMGDLCENQLGQLEQAVRWYKGAADEGSPEGSRYYADMLMAGKGVSRDYEQAKKYYEMAARGGIPEAQFVMGEFCRNEGERDIALKWYKESNKNGYTNAAIRVKQMNDEQR